MLNSDCQYYLSPVELHRYLNLPKGTEHFGSYLHGEYQAFQHAGYDNLDIIEDVYGINLRPLLNLAEKYYDDNPAFRPKADENRSEAEIKQITKIHQAIAMIQFKLESPINKRRPNFNMEERLLLEKIDYDKNEITLNGKTYQLENTCFATINPEQPDKLLEEKAEVLDKLLFSVQHSEKLGRHMKFMMKKGSLYLKYNGNLLIHGCIPVDENGNMETMMIEDKAYAGRELLDVFERFLREAFAHPDKTDNLATDMVWYLWTGESSSLFGKRAMTTFERYFMKEKETHKEKKNPFYYLREDEATCRNILAEFGLNPDNGHTPVKEIEGEDPNQSKQKNDRHRRRLLQSLPIHNRHRRLHAAIQLLRHAARRP